jgi:hypothetical protein
MKNSYKILIGAVVCIILGGALILTATNISIPSTYSTFLGIPYAVNPAYVSSFDEMMGLLMVGFMLLGFGIGMGLVNGYVSMLERRMSQIPLPPSKVLCRYCGTQNAPDSVFCSKCGKELT